MPALFVKVGGDSLGILGIPLGGYGLNVPLWSCK